MFFRTAILAIAIVLLTPALAAEPSFGPVIDGYGPTYPVDDRDVRLPEGFVYKVVFDIAQDPAAGSVNQYLVSVARFINMHARNGVPVEEMDIAIVVHGRAVGNLLDNEENPNLELLTKLQDAGVKIYVCGQSMAFAGIAGSDLTEGVQLALSAMTMLTILQSDGYALLPWGA
jgi:intracellular sulfur oxidation DsrE/DsrF family protein